MAGSGVPRVNRLSEDQKRRILALVREGLPKELVASRVGCSRGTVYTVLTAEKGKNGN